jgi:phosphoribosyl-AMP cyclohydrolase
MSMATDRSSGSAAAGPAPGAPSGSTASEAAWLDEVVFDAAGLVPVIAQDEQNGQVLMLAWANRAALQQTLQTGLATYFSRSRGRLWCKGETSGHTQQVSDIRLDCDGDAILYRVRQVGAGACHTGRARCFYRRLEGDAWVVTDPVLADPQSIYGKEGT